MVAAAVAFIPWKIDDSLHVGGLLSFFAFAIAFGLALRLATERPMDNWYEGRAGAESVIRSRRASARCAPGISPRARPRTPTPGSTTRQWYDGKAEIDHRRAQRWGLLDWLASMAGLVAALLRATLIFDPEIDPLSVFATLATAVTAWIQAGHFQTLATSYGIAGQELGTIAIRLAHVDTEPAWAVFVRDAEAAISREHALWLTRRAEVAV